MSPAVLSFRRAELEARIEDLIELLDLMDGDENLEPYLADSSGDDREGAEDHCAPGLAEGDGNADHEPWLGWQSGGRHGERINAEMSCDDDREADSADYEDGADTEPNGDEADFTRAEDEFGSYTEDLRGFRPDPGSLFLRISQQ